MFLESVPVYFCCFISIFPALSCSDISVSIISFRLLFSVSSQHVKFLNIQHICSASVPIYICVYVCVYYQRSHFCRQYIIHTFFVMAWQVSQRCRSPPATGPGTWCRPCWADALRSTRQTTGVGWVGASCTNGLATNSVINYFVCTCSVLLTI